MMPKDFIGKGGIRYSAQETSLGKGGEGMICSVKDRSDMVMKLFWEKKRTETRHRKLQFMVENPIPETNTYKFAWPEDLLYDGDGFAGYVMPAVRDHEKLDVMYSRKYICTLSDRLDISRYLCRAIQAVHEAGQVCGDLNPENIYVNPLNGHIVLIDTDSFHITDDTGSERIVYRCEMGAPDYLPRELQEKMKNGMDLSNAPDPTFTRETDYFALAVHIFQLLMNGCHPFGCAVNFEEMGPVSVVNPKPVENICDGFFIFTMKKEGFTPPKYAPDFSYLPEEIQNLFIRAFVNGHENPEERPDCETWYTALGEMKKCLISCEKNSIEHMYPNYLDECPWCAVEERMRLIINKEDTSKVKLSHKIPELPEFEDDTDDNNVWKWLLVFGTTITVLLVLIVMTLSGSGIFQRKKKRDGGNTVESEISEIYRIIQEERKLDFTLNHNWKIPGIIHALNGMVWIELDAQYDMLFMTDEDNVLELSDTHMMIECGDQMRADLEAHAGDVVELTGYVDLSPDGQMAVIYVDSYN